MTINNRLNLLSIPLIIMILFVSGCNKDKNDEAVSGSKVLTATKYKRIISLAPSITETLFALGLGERVVGVTRYCVYPPETLKKERIGGYTDPNYEKIAGLKPDIVFLLTEHDKAKNYFSELGIECKILKNRTTKDIMETIMTIGGMCGVNAASDSLTKNISSRMHAIRKKNAGLASPRILISIGRNMGTGSIKDIYIAGKGTFYDELIELAGGINAYQGRDAAYPLLSAEGLMTINPDIIIDLVPDLEKKGLTKKAVMSEWQSVSRVKAVNNSGLFVLGGDYTVVPGPRFIILLEDIAEIVNKTAVK